MQKSFKEILSGANKLRKVKIRYTISQAGKYNLLLDYSSGNKRERVYLGLYLTGKPEYVNADNNTLREAMHRRDELEQIVLSGGSLRSRPHATFQEYAQSILSGKRDKNRVGYTTAVRRFVELNGDIKLESVTPEKITAFMRSISALSPNTKNHYMFALRHIFDKAHEEGIIQDNPCKGIKKAKVITHKEFLTIPEIKTLIDHPCEIPGVKNAFLFSCFTGLRYGDLKTISSKSIKDGYLHWKQSKTGTHERILIPEIALQFAPDPVFYLPEYTWALKNLKRWIADAGIDKHITFHCARHTFATLCITLGVDIYTVSKLLGHSDVRMTQVYAKLVDEKKDEAAKTISKVF